MKIFYLLLPALPSTIIGYITLLIYQFGSEIPMPFDRFESWVIFLLGSILMIILMIYSRLITEEED